MHCDFRKVVWILCLGLSSALAVSARAADAPCAACHAEAAQSVAAMPHGKLGVACGSCHGDGAAHLAAPSAATIRTFSTEPAAEQDAACAGCHSNAHSTERNAHSAAGITCASCHGIHAQKKSPLVEGAALPADLEHLGPGSSLCFECHQETFTQFAFNERHRLAEGSVACTSCHDPHNPRLGMELGGFKQSVCSDCHADVEGPFVFEHAASRVDGCGACHDPHGSPNRHMLSIQQVGALCYSCHAEVPQFHAGFSPTAAPRFDETTVCTNCHVTIHGSNLDRFFLR